MVVSADTSFLFSLYGTDVFTPEAETRMQNFDAPISISQFGEFELANALRLAESRGLRTPEDTARSLSSFSDDVATGQIELPACNLVDVVSTARRLSIEHTVKGGHRGFDILLVAFALEIGTGSFLTFDKNQMALAVAEGLTVPE